jgi:hypothetical protein
MFLYEQVYYKLSKKEARDNQPPSDYGYVSGSEIYDFPVLDPDSNGTLDTEAGSVKDD